MGKSEKKPMQMRLDAETIDQIEYIMSELGVSNRTEAVRVAVRAKAEMLWETRKVSAKEVSDALKHKPGHCPRCRRPSLRKAKTHEFYECTWCRFRHGDPLSPEDKKKLAAFEKDRKANPRQDGDRYKWGMARKMELKD